MEALSLPCYFIKAGMRERRENKGLCQTTEQILTRIHPTKQTRLIRFVQIQLNAWQCALLFKNVT